MAGTRSRRRLERQSEEKNQLDQAAAASSSSSSAASGQNQNQNLTPTPTPTPCLLLPGPQESYDETATALSIATGKSKSVRTSDAAAAMRGHVAIGSSGGWLVTADDRGALRMANPVTGAHADLPPIATVPFLHPTAAGGWFCLDVKPFLQIRFGGSPPPPSPEHKDWQWPRARSFTLSAAQLRQVFYRKVVLSPSPARATSYAAAMLLTDRYIGAPFFATAAEDAAAAPAAWRMAPSRDGVEDAIHHGGRFLSITYAGHVEAWRRDAETGEFAADEVAPRLAAYEDDAEHLRRKYLAVSPDGRRLMVVLKHTREEDNPRRRYRAVSKNTRVFFKVVILDGDEGRWEEAADIGDAAIFVGVNASICLSATEHPGIAPGCVYFTDDDVGAACLRNHHRNAAADSEKSSYFDDADLVDELRDVGVYSLKTCRVERIGGVGKDQLWPPPAWFTPSFS